MLVPPVSQGPLLAGYWLDSYPWTAEAAVQEADALGLGQNHRIS